MQVSGLQLAAVTFVLSKPLKSEGLGFSSPELQPRGGSCTARLIIPRLQVGKGPPIPCTETSLSATGAQLAQLAQLPQPGRAAAKLPALLGPDSGRSRSHPRGAGLTSRPSGSVELSAPGVLQTPTFPE